MINIDILRAMNRPEQIAITEHARMRLNERRITVSDIMACIGEGEIIEQYETDKPLASCLILGLSVNNKYLHVVVSHDEEYIYLITAYYPNANRWESDFKTRKGR